MKENQLNGLLSQTKSVCSDSILSQIKVEMMFKIYETCIIPCLLYGSETWTLNSTEKQYLSKIQGNILRKILKIPESTPLLALFMDTGIYPIMNGVEKRQLVYLWKLVYQQDDSLSSNIFNCLTKYKSHENNWMKNINELLSKYGLID